MIDPEKLQTWLSRPLRGLIAAALLVSASGFWGFTLGADEGWNLVSVAAVIGQPEIAYENAPVLSSTGLYAALHGAAFRLGIEQLAVHRALSLGAALVAWWLALQLLPRESRGPDAGWLVAAGIAAAPGAITFASLAFAEWLAAALVVGFVVALERDGSRGWGRSLICAGLLGLAMATRSTAIAVVPGFLIWSWIGPAGRFERVRDAVIIAALAGALFMGFTAAYSSMAPTTTVATETLTTMGLQGLVPDYPRLMNRWLVGERLLPIASLVAASVLLIGWGVRRAGRLPPWSLLLAMAWSGWALWMLRAPIAHLRYLWPAVALLGVGVGLGLAMLARREGRHSRTIALALAIGITIGPVMSATRHLVNGNSDIIAWEWSGEAALSYTRRFQQVRDQRDIAAWMQANVPASEEIAIFSQPYAMRFLSRRNLVSMWNYADASEVRWKSERRPVWILLQPTNHAFRYLPAAAMNWIAAACTLEAQFGAYVLYRVDGPWPESATPFRLEGRPYETYPLAAPRFGG